MREVKEAIKERRKIDRFMWKVWAIRRERLEAIMPFREDAQDLYKEYLASYAQSFEIMATYLKDHYTEDGAYWRLMSLALNW